MNVEQLIEELKKHDPKKMVVVAGYEGGHNEIDMVSEIRLNLDVNTRWYYGKHEQDQDGACHAIAIA
jgi:hypothetical protein